jgi:lysozyme family protein
MHKSDPYTLSLALSESNRRKQLRQGAQMGQQQPQPKVVDQEIAQMGPQMPSQQGMPPQGMPQGMPPQQLPEDVGIGQLPAPNMQRMATGGIVAFEEGGEVPGYAGGVFTGSDPFDDAFRRVMRYEGGYVANDAGKGPSKFGINKAANSDLDIAKLTEKDAKRIYRERYWDKIGGDELAKKNPALATVAFDTAVNMGVTPAKRLVEQSGGDPSKILAAREQHYASLVKKDPETFAKYQSGWQSRLADLATSIFPSAAAAELPQTRAQANTPAPQGGNGIDDLGQAAFGRYPSSGVKRQKGRLSEAITSGTGPGQMIEGATDLPYNLAGIPMDISHQVAKVFGSKTPNENIFGTSAYLKNKATEAGIRKPETTDPTLAGFRKAGELGSLLVNPPGAGAGIPRLLTPETSRVIGATGKTKADQIIPDLNYKTAQQLDAARLTPAEIAELAKLRNAPPAVQPQSLLGYDAPQGLLTHGATPPPAAAPAAESGLPTLLKGDLVPPGPGASRQEILAFESNLRKQAQELKEAYPVATQADVAAMRAEGNATPVAQQNYGQPPMRYTADEDRARKLAAEKLAARPPATTAVTEASAVKPAITEANAVRTTATRPLVDAVGPSAAALKTGEGVASLLSNRPTTTELEPDWDMSKGLASLPDTKDLEKIGKEATPKSERKGMSGEDFLMIGLGIMSGQSPHAITNIGEGGLKGLQMVQASRKEASEAAAREMMAERYGIGAEVQLVNAMRDPTFAANYRTLVEAKNDPRQMQALAQEMLKTPGQMEMLKKLDPTLYEVLRKNVLGGLMPTPLSSPGATAPIRAPIPIQ